MKLPSGEELKGTIRLDVNRFRADAQAIAREAKNSAQAVAKAYKPTTGQAGAGFKLPTQDIAKFRSEMEASAKSAIALDAQRQKALSEASRLQAQAEKQRSAAAEKFIKDEVARLDRRLAGEKKIAAEAERAARQQQVAQARIAASAVQAENQRIAGIRRTAQEQERATRKLISDIERSLQQETRLRAKPYEDLRRTVGEARTTFLAFTAAAVGTVVAGLRAADSIQLLTIRYRELAGGQREGIQLMRQVENVANDMGLPIRQTQKDFLGLIPAVRAVNGSLEDYANVALRLATLNTDSRGGVEGAIYAIREALSSGGTDLVSLSERFNIPRKALRELIEETGDLATALDIILDRYGATDEAAKANARTLANIGARTADLANRILEKTFAGALETVKNLLEGLNTALENVPQPMVDIGATAVVTAGALAGTVLAIESIVGAFTRARAAVVAFTVYLRAQALPAMLTFARSVIVAFAPILAVIAAVTAAGVLTVGAINAVGRSTGDERLANFGLDDMVETIKQGFFVAVELLLRVLEPFALGIGHVITGLQNMQNALDAFALRTKIAALDMAIGIQRALGVFGDQALLNQLQMARGVTGVVKGADGSASRQGFGLVNELALLEDGFTTFYDQTAQGIRDTFNGIRTGILNAFYPPEVAQGVESISEAFENLIFRAKVRLYEYFDAQGTAFAATVDDQISLYQEIQDILESGDAKGLEDRLRGLEIERQSIEQLLPSLRRHAEYSDEAAEKLAELEGRLSEITTTLPQLLSTLDEVFLRGIVEAGQKYNEEIKDAEEARKDALLKLAKDDRKDALDLAKRDKNGRDKIREDNLKAEDTYRKSILKAEETFRKRMADIQANYVKAITTAVSSLDAAAVLSAIQTRNEQRREAGEQQTEAREQAQERLNEQRMEAVKALEDLRLELAERRAEMKADRAARLQEIKDEFLEAKAVATEARNTEINELRAFYTQRLADLAVYQEQERALLAEQNAKRLADIVKSVILPTVQDFMQNPLVRGIVGTGAGVLGALAGRGTQGGTNIGSANFVINDATDPQAVANAVNRQLINLSNPSGSFGFGAR